MIVLKHKTIANYSCSSVVTVNSAAARLFIALKGHEYHVISLKGFIGQEKQGNVAKKR